MCIFLHISMNHLYSNYLLFDDEDLQHSSIMFLFPSLKLLHVHLNLYSFKFIHSFCLVIIKIPNL